MPSPSAKSQRDSAPNVRRVLDAASWLSVAVIVACAALVLTFDHGRDQSIYSLVAREILAGRMPYKDAFDFKPPGIFLMYALARALFGPAMVGIRILEVAAMLGTAWGMIRLSERLFGRRTVGLFAAALASQIHLQLDFWHTAQPETFGATMTIWALVLSTRALDAPARGRALGLWIAAGALFGASGLMKPPLAGAGAMVVLLVGAREILDKRSLKALDPLRSWIPLAGMVAGGAAPFALILGWFWAKGALGDLHQVLFVFTPEYTKISWEKQSLLPMAYYGFTEWLSGYSGALLAGILALLAFRPTKDEALGVAAIFGCIFVHVAGIVMQGKFFPYHWGATFPLTALLAALGLEKALVFAAARGLPGVAAFTAIFSTAAYANCTAPNFGEGSFGHRNKKRLDLLLSRPADPVTAWDELACIADVDAVQNRAVAVYVAEHTAKEDPLFVWGFECAIYDLADRPLASKFIYNVPQRAIWSDKPMQEALMADLTKTPPKVIVVEHHDVFPMVTGSTDDSAVSLSKFKRLRSMLDDEYRFAEKIGDFDIYFRREAPYEVGQPSSD
ncbi:MAG: glycosyltransferase family 39 protein [Polyangiaceae bacterium]|nr:glycosyltransferase family 39 protein [Polyangiaceae bacterium]